MSKKAPHTVHHIIPQCYLRNFTNMAKGIYMYDKIRSTKYIKPIDEACAIDHFYRIADFNAKNEDEALSIEVGYLAKAVETTYSDILQEVIETKDQWISNSSVRLSNELKVKLAYMIGVQYLRMPCVRDAALAIFKTVTDFEERLVKKIAAEQEQNPAILDLQINKRYDEASIHAQSTFQNDRLLLDFCIALSRNYWTFLVSQENKFYTSDSPIVVLPHVEGVRPTHCGLTQYGAELSFPISKDIMVVIWDKDYFSAKASEDCSFRNATDAELRKYNMLRYGYATESIFEYNNDFSWISFITTVNGGKHLCLNNTGIKIAHYGTR